MIIFSIICLTLIIVLTTMFIYFMWKQVDSDIEGQTFVATVLTLIYIVVIYFIVRTIIIWGQPLNLH